MRPGYDASPKSVLWKRLATPLILSLLAFAMYRTGRPPVTPPNPVAWKLADLSVADVHLGDRREQVVKIRGNPASSQSAPDHSSEVLTYSNGDMVILGKDHTVEALTGESLIMPKGRIKIGDPKTQALQVVALPSNADDGAVRTGKVIAVWRSTQIRLMLTFAGDRVEAINLSRTFPRP